MLPHTPNTHQVFSCNRPLKNTRVLTATHIGNKLPIPTHRRLLRRLLQQRVGAHHIRLHFLRLVGTNALYHHPDSAGDRFRFPGAVRFEHPTVQSQQWCPAVLFRRQLSLHIPKNAAAQQGSELAHRIFQYFFLYKRFEFPKKRFAEFQNDIADKTVAHNKSNPSINPT